MNKPKYVLISLTFLFVSILSYAQDDFPKHSEPPKLVNDFTKTLSKREIRNLENKLQQFAKETSNQITVVLVKSLNGYSVVEYADILGDKWGIGQKDKDNGVLVLIKSKTKKSRGEVRISIGYGLEGIIPDAIGKRIIEYEMIPKLKQNDYYAALDKSTSVLMGLAKKEFNSDEYLNNKKSGGKAFFIAPFFAILIAIILLRAAGRRSQTYGSSNSSLPLWGIFFLGSSMGRSNHGSNWSNFSGGSGGFGGGGFGGFGGGSFGGGGASGSW